MNHQDCFFNCSREYVDSIDSRLYAEIADVIRRLPKRSTQTEINNDLFWLLTSKGWSYDTLSGVTDQPRSDLDIQNGAEAQVGQHNNRKLCLTSSTLDASWHSDFAKCFPCGLVQIEAQFGKVESAFKDFCGFRIARYERRLALGIEIVLAQPTSYFSHRKASVGGMAYFGIAKETLPAIGLDCPIWLVGISET